MRQLRPLALLLICSFCPVVCFGREGDLQRFSFNKRFISSSYASDSALGRLSTRLSKRARQVHSSSCGGNDAELHIGISIDDVIVADNQMPISLPVVNDDPGWGVVAELPNAARGNGPARFDELEDQPITFTGYFRVWNEGHARGAVHDSNPHHVFEVHPAWAFSGEGVRFNRRNLVDSISGFSGYGASKFKEIFRSLSDEEWPLVFQDDTNLHVELMEASNFFQLPIIIREIHDIEGGHEVVVDVFSDQNFQRNVYRGLRCITVEGSPIDSTLSLGRRTFWLGIFSVNLRVALDASNDARSEDDAVVVPDAVEFFVFGPATQRAVRSSSCTADRN